jgi:WD40 repeat protein
MGRAQWDLTSMAVSHEATIVAAGTAQSRIDLFDLRNARRVRPLSADAPGDAPVADDPDSRPTNGDGGVAAVGAVASTDVEPLPEFSNPMWGHNGPVYGLDFSWDSRLLYSCGADGTVRMWPTEFQANLVVWEGHQLPVWDVRACPVGHWVASGGADWTAKLWCAADRLLCVLCEWLPG